MSGNFLSCSKGVKDPLEVPEFRCDLPQDASAELSLISPEGENLLDFLELRQVLSTYDGDHRDPLWWPQERPVPMRVPLQYCSLQHRTLLLSPVTSTAGYCFCFGSIPSFFLELFLH